MNERQAKKKMKNQMNQKIDEYKKQLEKLQEEFNRNLDEDLIPINEGEARRISARIQEINRYYYKALEEKNSLKEKNTQTISDGDDEPIIELPTKEIKEEINKPYDDSNIKIECDLKNSLYRIYSKYSKVPYIHVISKELLNPNSSKYMELVRELKKKYGSNINIDNFDLNVIEAFSEFDRKYNTDCTNGYIKDTFNGEIYYDIRKFRLRNQNIVSNNYLSLKEKKFLISNAKNYNKSHENCKLVTNKKSAVMLGVGLSVIGLTAGGISSINTKDNSDNIKESTIIESTIEEDLEKIDKLPEIVTTEVKKDNITTEELVEGMPVDADLNDTVFFDEDEDRVIRVGDIISAKDMENINLYKLPTDAEPVGNTEKWPSIAAYKFAGICPTDVASGTYISIKVNGESIETAIRNDNISTEELKKILDEQYGPGYSIRLHAMALDENGNVINDKFGWVDLDELTIENKNAMTK